jgi:ketosteroid isomerase-like protein
VSAENLANVRRYVEEFNRRDFDSLIADTDPAVELCEWPEAPGAQTYRGPDGLRQALGRWFEAWEWMHLDIAEIVDAGDRVLVSLNQRARGSGSGAEVELTSHNVYTFRDGNVTRVQLFIDREAAVAAAGLTPNYQEEKR